MQPPRATATQVEEMLEEAIAREATAAASPCRILLADRYQQLKKAAGGGAEGEGQGEASGGAAGVSRLNDAIRPAVRDRLRAQGLTPGPPRGRRA